MVATREVEPVGSVLRRVYESRAEAVAVRDAHRELTYGDLRARAAQLAGALSGAGVKAGDRLMMVVPNGCEWIEIDHACYMGGIGRAAILARLHPHELEVIAADAEPSIVIVDGGWLQSAGTEWIPDGIEHLVVIGEMPTTDARAVGYDEFTASGTVDELPLPDPDGLSWLMYTSGTTGKPKGVVYTQRTVGAMVRNVLSEMPDVGESDVALHTAPLSHFTGAVALAIFFVGGVNATHVSFQPAAVIDAIVARDANIVPLVPTQITMLLDELRQRVAAGRSTDLSGLRLIPYAGSAMAPDRVATARKLFGDVLLQFYGTTESPMPLTALQPSEHTAAPGPSGLPRLASAGNANEHVGVRVLREDGVPAAAGEPGEIAVRGPQTMPGYWRNPEATAEVLHDGWFVTGDVGYLDADGFLFIVDRKKDMIVTGGFNVYPREVENAISPLSGVREVAVVGSPSERWGEEIRAVISLVPDAGLTEEQVIDHCRKHIAGYKVPKRVEFVDDLPKSGTGKILKREIRADLWAGRERRV